MSVQDQVLKGIILLLVDDDVEIREIFAEELCYHGAVVHTAIHSEDALKILRSGVRIDVVISDLRMPGGDGLSLQRTIRREFGSNAPRFVLVTGYSELSAEQIAAEGVCAVFEKPLDWSQFLTCLALRESGKN